MTVVKCDWCSEEINQPDWQIRKQKHHYCSRSHAAKGRCYCTDWSSPTKRPDVAKKVSGYWKTHPDEHPAKRSDVRKQISESLTTLYSEHPEKHSTSQPDNARKQSLLMTEHNPMYCGETRKKISDIVKKWHTENPMPDSAGFGKGGYFLHNGKYIWLRSTYETRYAGILTTLGLQWEYERRFHVDSIDQTYLIDFYIPEHDLYIEVKGYLTERAKTKMTEFHKQYPDIDLIVVWNDEKNGNHIADLEHEIGCYAPIDLKTFGTSITRQLEAWNVVA